MITRERRRRITLLMFIVVAAFNTVTAVGCRAADGNWISVFLTGGGTLVLAAIVVADNFLVRDPGGDPDGG